MKELSIEEKAKAYDEAIERAKSVDDFEWSSPRDIAECIFPQLKESEDERIRKEIIDFATKANNGVTSILASNYDFNKWIAWLEKQGEQKLAWSEEDETALGDALWCCKQAASIAKDENDMGNVWYVEHWLKSLKDRVQPKNEWSKEDEREVVVLKAYICSREWSDSHIDRALGIVDELVKKLKSLRPQSTWKPSGEQMEYLAKAITTLGDEGDCKTALILNDLRFELKKLKEE